MSNIAMQGGATGTGTVTLLAPSTSTNRTINLPDSNGTVLTTATAGVPVNGPAFSAYSSANQSVTSGVITKIILNVERFDTASAFDSTTNYRFTPQVAGYYQINASFRGTGSVLTGSFLNLYKNGAIYQRLCEQTGNQITTLGCCMVYLNGSTDYIEAYGSVTASSGAAFDAPTSTGEFSCGLNGSLVRSAV